MWQKCYNCGLDKHMRNNCPFWEIMVRQKERIMAGTHTTFKMRLIRGRNAAIVARMVTTERTAVKSI